MIGLGARRLPRRLHQDPPAAQPRPAGAGQVRRPAGRRASSSRSWRCCSATARADPGVDAPVLRARHRRARVRLGRVRRPRLPDRLRHLERGEPHRRPGRAGRRRRGDGVRRVHADHVPAVPQPRACTDPAAGCYHVRDPLDLALVAASAMAACFGFLWWNASPAQIFMGDTGSMALGGLMAGLAILDPHRAAARRPRRPVRRRSRCPRSSRPAGSSSPEYAPAPATGVPDGAAASPLRARRLGARSRSSCGSGSSPGSRSPSAMGLFYADFIGNG